MRLANPTRPLPSFFIAIATWKWSMFSSLHFHFQLNSMEINNHYKLVKNMSLIKKNFLSRAYALPFLVSAADAAVDDALLSCLSQLKTIAIWISMPRPRNHTVFVMSSSRRSVDRWMGLLCFIIVASSSPSLQTFELHLAKFFKGRLCFMIF